jgi:hypothetical protein
MKALMIALASSVALAASAAAEPLLFDVACQQQSVELILIDPAGQRVTMRSITAQTRTAARAMGFGGVGQYAVLPGRSAMYRLPSNQPTFLLAAPSNIQPQGLFTLARFEPRPNGSREVLIGGGYMSYSSGISADRQVALNARQAPSQAGAPAGTILYELTPAAPLAAGEYAMIVSMAAAQGGGGVFGGAPVMGTYYDFGVD